MVETVHQFLHSHKLAIEWVAGMSFLVFIGSLILVPWIVIQLPVDYFAKRKRTKMPFAKHHPVLRWIGLVIKNCLGALLIVAGVAMLLLPGQGILTVAIGVLLLDFPGKHALEAKIIGRKPVLNSINWIRRKANVPPLEVRQDVEKTERAPATMTDRRIP